MLPVLKRIYDSQKAPGSETRLLVSFSVRASKVCLSLLNGLPLSDLYRLLGASTNALLQQITHSADESGLSLSVFSLQQVSP